ncbi:hypothetical protein [Pseudonocardia spirodelae]|uniref:Uncharacterized protein n=1 Tax=Pseudonocardia spirodelae TaxID=3133431 RepID=A0ABU8T8N4_9PSEU
MIITVLPRTAPTGPRSPAPPGVPLRAPRATSTGPGRPGSKRPAGPRRPPTRRPAGPETTGGSRS